MASTDNAWVRFGGLKEVRAILLSNSSLVCTLPTGLIPGYVRVALSLNGIEYSDMISDIFMSSATVHVSPSRGYVIGGDNLVFSGMHFQGDSSLSWWCKFGSLPPLAAEIITSSLLSCNAPLHSAGAVQVSLGNNASQGHIIAKTMYEYREVPVIVDTYPQHGVEAGGSDVRIVGSHFVPGQDAVCLFGRSGRQIAAVLSSTLLRCMSAALIDSGETEKTVTLEVSMDCLLYTSPSPRDGLLSRMPSSA